MQVRVAQAILGDDADEAGGIWQSDRWDKLAGVEECGKLRVLEKLLSLWALNKEDKVLIFSYSTRLLSILEKFLLARQYTFSRLDGATSTAERRKLVDDFNNPRRQTMIFLISTCVRFAMRAFVSRRCGSRAHAQQGGRHGAQPDGRQPGGGVRCAAVLLFSSSSY